MVEIPWSYSGHCIDNEEPNALLLISPREQHSKKMILMLFWKAFDQGGGHRKCMLQSIEEGTYELNEQQRPILVPRSQSLSSLDSYIAFVTSSFLVVLSALMSVHH